jgi:RHS repeat-associated protein
LSYYGARYFDKNLMTWTQSDPLYRFSPDAAWTEPRRALLYAADLNNPLKYLDPDGRSPGGAAVRAGVWVAETLPAPPPAKLAAGALTALFVWVVGTSLLPNPSEYLPPKIDTPKVTDLGHGAPVPVEGTGEPGKQIQPDTSYADPTSGDPYRDPPTPTPPKPKAPYRPPLPIPGPTAPPPSTPKKIPGPFDIPVDPEIAPDMPGAGSGGKKGTATSPGNGATKGSAGSSPSSGSKSNEHVQPFGCGIECVPAF